MARGHGFGRKGVRIAEIVGKISGIAAKRRVTAGRAIATAAAIDKTAARIIRIAAGVGVPTARISRVIGKPGVTTAGISSVPGEMRAIIARISRVIRDPGKITAGIFGPIAKFGGTPNDIILQGWIAKIGPLPNITGMETPADPTKREVTAELTD